MSYLHVGKYQNNYYQSIERTRGNVVWKMIKWLSTLVFPQSIVGNDRNSDCSSIYLTQGVLSFLRKHDTFLAVQCTLLSHSCLAIYLQKATTQKTEKKRKKEEKSSVGLEPGTIGSMRLHLTTTPQRLIKQFWEKSLI